jgi:AcrR family transcriptional regulator
MPYRPTERTAANRERTRERIVQAAIDQLADGGYASAGVAAVARRAGVATGSVYRHFPSKAELFAEVAQAVDAPGAALALERLAQRAVALEDVVGLDGRRLVRHLVGVADGAVDRGHRASS